MEREKQKLKIFAVSDIHGCATALETALNEVGFDPKNPCHLLIVLGDLFDRGTENRRVLEYLSGISRHKVCATKIKILNSPTSPYFIVVETKP